MPRTDLRRAALAAALPLALVLPLAAASPARAAPEAAAAPCADVACLERRIASLEGKLEAQRLVHDEILKGIDDVLWFDRVGDVASVDKVYLVGPPDPNAEETYGIANARHPFKFWSYVFVPRKLGREKAPLVVLPHGGVHADFTTYHTHIVRELVEQGYVVVAPEYRGSTGYGKAYEQAIDYGGLEVLDAVAARDWAVESLPQVDGRRVAIVGWSHGGLIALMAAFDHPDKFQACFAGVPVSDLVMRMGYLTDDYRALFSAKHHVGKTANEAVDEYRRRSPAWNAAKLRTPLLVHATTNDRDVNVIEVQALVAQLQAAGKKFRHRIWEDAPGGHSFDRIDTKLAREARAEIWSFLAEHLKR
ncbi:MAG TPA: alpha/beta fold hydrolase [Anaeromyxobacteraceae bacterium]|nr:alpha/beta fold hydrolase [Anaeromyxobacteraceae bacterium]